MFLILTNYNLLTRVESCTCWLCVPSAHTSCRLEPVGGSSPNSCLGSGLPSSQDAHSSSTTWYSCGGKHWEYACVCGGESWECGCTFQACSDTGSTSGWDWTAARPCTRTCIGRPDNSSESTEQFDCDVADESCDVAGGSCAVVSHLDT
jgi:hypothetical protein